MNKKPQVYTNKKLKNLAKNRFKSTLNKSSKTERFILI